MDSTGYRAAMARLLDTLDLIWVQGTPAQRTDALGGLLLAASDLPTAIDGHGPRGTAVTPTVRRAILGSGQDAARQDALQRQQEAGLTDEDRRAIQAETRKLARRSKALVASLADDPAEKDWEQQIRAVRREEADLGARLDGGALRAAVRQAITQAAAEGMDRRLIAATFQTVLQEQLPEGATR